MLCRLPVGLPPPFFCAQVAFAVYANYTRNRKHTQLQHTPQLQLQLHNTTARNQHNNTTNQQTQAEVGRVEATGAWVLDGRVCGVLAVSRAFGDPEFKVGVRVCVYVMLLGLGFRATKP